MTASVNIQSEKASILLIYTGGTIGMIENPETGVLESFNFQHLKDNMPELKKLGYAVSTIQFDPAMDSSEMGPESWMKIVKIIADNYQLYDGFVVLHGTDTMSFTASALSFMLENLSKPVIFTGSQLPIGMLRTDGKENLITAIEIAAAKENGVPVVPEVCIFFENDLLRGNRTSKINADNFNAFRSYNYPPLAHAGIVGMGGACFPTHVKLTPPPGCKAECVIINAVECEPYLTADHRLMLETNKRTLYRQP